MDEFAMPFRKNDAGLTHYGQVLRGNGLLDPQGDKDLRNRQGLFFLQDLDYFLPDIVIDSAEGEQSLS